VGRVWPRHGHRGRPLNRIVRQHAHMDTVSDFQQRRREVGRKAGPWLVLGIVASGWAFFQGVEDSWRLAMLAAIGIASVGVGAFIVHRKYRCPNCGEVPGTKDGILINPTACPSCGIALK
jgi:hypothetical protein